MSKGKSDLEGMRLVVDYWPSWADNWTRDKLSASRANIINIAFALPDGHGNITWNDDINPEQTKKTIAHLRKSGKKVLISVGGATAHNWNLNTIDIRTFARNIKSFIDTYGLDGVDIDYESPNHREKLIDLIRELRSLMPAGLITYAAWSTGAYGVRNKGYEHPEWWDGNEHKGMEIPILKEVGHLLDWVNVMSYDAFDSSIKHPFDPREAIEAYRNLLGGDANKVLLGIELGNHSWPSDAKTTTEQVRPWVKYALDHGYRGVMFWTLDFDVRAKTGEDNGAFHKLLDEMIPSFRAGAGAKVSASAATAAAAGPVVGPASAAALAASASAAPASAASASAVASKGKAEPEDASSEKILSNLLKDHQSKIRELQDKQKIDLEKIKESYEVMFKQEKQQLENVADPHQREELKKTFAVHKQQIDTHLNEIRKSQKAQLDHFQTSLKFQFDQVKEQQERQRRRPT